MQNTIARQLFRSLFTSTPKVLLTGLLLWTSSCSSLDRWGAAKTVPVAPHVAEKVRRERSAPVTHAFASQTEAEASEAGVQPLSHEAVAAGQSIPQTNDPFAHAETSPESYAAIEKMLRRQQAASAGSSTGNGTSRPVATPASQGPASQAATAAALTVATENPFASMQRERRQVMQDPAFHTISNEVVSAEEFVAPAAPQAAASGMVQVFDCEPRLDLGNAPGYCPPLNCPPGNCPPGECPPSVIRTFPPEDTSDEYICDGGDKNLPVHYNGGVRVGLDPEDTVIEYLDGTGEMRVKASSRTCVYAPRFGSVRSTTAPNERYHVTRATGSHDQQQVAGFDHRMVIDERVQRDEPKRLETRSRASGVDQQTVDATVAKDSRALNHAKTLNVYEDFAFFREGQFELVDAAVLANGIDAALAWSSGQPPIVQGHLRSGFEVQSRVYAQEKVGIEDQRTPAELTITKLADKKVAAAGDSVTFTIRFDNLGGHDVLKLRLVDHLSPRLLYVDGSVDASLEGKLDVSSDGKGGQILTFEFEQPLAGHAGGWVSFTCKVR